jgi:hypothetical protein
MSSSTDVPPFFEEEAAPAGPPGDPALQAAAGTWVLQGDAAARTGFSVSAIRKWRRMGFVAERKIVTGADLPRVEVKLEDVLARAALQPQRRPSSGAEPEGSVATPTGCVTIGLGDLEELFERMVRAERRAERAEAEVQAMEVQARYTLGQMAELRRQLAANGGPPRGSDRPGGEPAEALPPAAAAALPPPATAGTRPETGDVTRTRTRTGAGTATGASAVRADAGRVISVPSRPPAASRPAPAPTPVPTGEGRPAAPDLEALAERLRSIYARLDGYRSAPVISPEMEARRQRELAEYDRALVAACRALGVATGFDPGAAVGVDGRARLTGALARAGLDVRANGDADTRRARTRWPTMRPRS